MKGPLFYSLRTRMVVNFGVLLFFAAMALPLFFVYGVPFTPLLGAKRTTYVKIFETLDWIAELKKDRISLWIGEWRNEARNIMMRIARGSDLRPVLDCFRYSMDKGREPGWELLKNMGAHRDLTHELEVIKKSEGDIQFIDVIDSLTGCIVVSTDPGRVGTAATDLGHIDPVGLPEVREALSVEQYSPQYPCLVLYHHVLDTGQPSYVGEALRPAILRVQIGMGEAIRSKLYSDAGLGKTGEIFLVDGHGLLLTPLRHRVSGSAGAQLMSYKPQGITTDLAARGEEGCSMTLDYRNEPVVAAFRHVQLTSEVAWGLIVKIDQSEIFAPMRRDITALCGAALIGAFMLLGFVAMASNRLSRSVSVLAGAAKEVEAGNLDVRVEISSSDEVGSLAHAFNSMVQRVSHWHETLVEEVAWRTHELNSANEGLQIEADERKKTEAALRDSEEKFRGLVTNIPGAVYRCAFDPGRGIIFISDGIRTISGYSASAFVGGMRSFASIIHPEDVAKVEQTLQERVASRQPFSIEYRIVDMSGQVRWVHEKGQAVFNDAGEVLWLDGLLFDVTQRVQAEAQVRASLREKEVLLQEVYHRTKNNMQVITSLLRLQSSKIKDKKYAHLFTDSEQRIWAMALVHEKLYQSRDLSNVDLRSYLSDLVNGLLVSHGAVRCGVRAALEIDEISLNLENVIPCGLVVSELVSNALKHAFPNGRPGQIVVRLSQVDESELELEVSDNGIGITQDLDPARTESLGLQLVNMLVEGQLKGSVKIIRGVGTRFLIRFRKRHYHPRI